MGGSAWDNKLTLKVEYDYSGQGLTGTAKALGVESKGNLSSTGGGDNIVTSRKGW